MDSIEYDLNLVGIGCVYDNLAILKCSAYDVNTFFRDGNCAAVCFGSAAGDGSCRLIKCNFYGFRRFVASALLTVCEFGVDSGFGQFQVKINIGSTFHCIFRICAL